MDAMAIASSVTNSVVWGLGILFGLAVTSLLMWALWYQAQFKYPIRIFDLADGSKIVRDDKAAIFIDRVTKGPFLKIKGLNEKIYGPIPPQAKHPRTKGGHALEVYRIAPGEYIWRCDKIRYFVRKAEDLPEGTDKNEAYIDYEFQPITSQQRSALVDELERSWTRSKKKALDYLLPIAGILGIIIIIAVLLIFGKGMVEPFLEVQSKVTALQDQTMKYDKEQDQRYFEMLERIDAIINDKQFIPRGTLGNATVIVNNGTT